MADREPLKWWRLDYDRLDDTHHQWKAYNPDGEEIAVMTGEERPEGIILHNHIYQWGPQTARELRRMFHDVRGMIRGMGIKLMMPCTDREHPEQIVAFWRFMGFRFITKQEQDGHIITIGVMQA